MPQNLCLAYIARSAQMAAHIHKHEFIAEHYFVSRMGMSADDIELNDVEVIQLFQTQAGQVTGRIRVDRLRFCEICSHPQERQSPETPQRHDAARTLRFSVTFFHWPPKTSHD